LKYKYSGKSNNNESACVITKEKIPESRVFPNKLKKKEERKKKKKNRKKKE
jgi:hypothetical protein